jgi:ubiquinone/menaquinone biosynthesis C-methylase UbiE
MLDVGCGRGAFTLAARKQGIEAYGFDFSRYAVNHPCPGCKKEWLKTWDATKTPWPYEDQSFDLVLALDFFEHLYLDDIPKVIDEMYRVAKKWVFLQIAVVGGGSGPGRHEKGYILKKGEPVPVELEANAAAGHCTVVDKASWESWLDRDYVIPRRDMVEWFYALVPKEYVVNWKQNLVAVMEKLE